MTYHHLNSSNLLQHLELDVGLEIDCSNLTRVSLSCLQVSKIRKCSNYIYIYIKKKNHSTRRPLSIQHFYKSTRTAQYSARALLRVVKHPRTVNQFQIDIRLLQSSRFPACGRRSELRFPLPAGRGQSGQWLPKRGRVIRRSRSLGFRAPPR